MIFCKEIEGTNWVFSIDFKVTCWGESACREYDAQPFAFEILSVKACIDEPNGIFVPATRFLIDQIIDDEDLAAQIEVESFEWLLVDQDRELEADEERRNYSAA